MGGAGSEGDGKEIGLDCPGQQGKRKTLINEQINKKKEMYDIQRQPKKDNERNRDIQENQRASPRQLVASREGMWRKEGPVHCLNISHSLLLFTFLCLMLLIYTCTYR